MVEKTRDYNARLAREKKAREAIEVEVVSKPVETELDAEMIQADLDAGLTKTEIGNKHGLTAVKVGMILKKGE